MVHGWPSGHTFKNLKREVILKLLDERDDMCTLLDPHLQKQSLSYRDAVLEIIKRDNDEPIPEALGDFVLAAISATTQIPIYVIKPIVERTLDVNNRPVTQYGAEVDFLFRKDKQRGKGANLVIMVYNGLDYYAPTLPKEISKMTRNSCTAITHLSDAIGLVEDILEDLPSSLARDSLTKSLSYMRAGSTHLKCTSLTTGTADVTSLPTERPVPHPISEAAAAKTAHKRASSTVSVRPPEKRKKETDEDFGKRQEAYRAAVQKAADRDTKLGRNQCPCGETFAKFQELLDHNANSHPDPTSLKCSKCDKVYKSKGNLWTHVRHHFKKYYHYCDVEYLDETDLDQDGNPKKKRCEKGADEVTSVEYHREVYHGVGKASVRCKHCDKPQMSNRGRLTHEKVCDEGPNKDGGPTDYCDICDYNCRSKSTLRNHYKTQHPEKVGLKKAKRWSCGKCGALFKSRTGAVLHDCTQKKKRGRKRKVAQTPVTVTGKFLFLQINKTI